MLFPAAVHALTPGEDPLFQHAPREEVAKLRLPSPEARGVGSLAGV